MGIGPAWRLKQKNNLQVKFLLERSKKATLLSDQYAMMSTALGHWRSRRPAKPDFSWVRGVARKATVFKVPETIRGDGI
jgi:hypothetical protein